MLSLVTQDTLVSGNSEAFSKFLDEQMNMLVVTLTYSLIDGDKSQIDSKVIQAFYQ